MVITEDKPVVIKGTPKVPFNQSKKLELGKMVVLLFTILKEIMVGNINLIQK